MLKVPAEILGWTVEEMHISMKWMFLSYERDEIQAVRSISRASGFTNDEMSEYVEKVIQFWAERDIYIPSSLNVEVPVYYETFD